MILTHRLSSWGWVHQQCSKLCGISLHIAAIECKLLIHNDRVRLAEDFSDFREGSVLLMPMQCGQCRCNNPVQERALMTGWTETRHFVVNINVIGTACLRHWNGLLAPTCYAALSKACKPVYDGVACRF